MNDDMLGWALKYAERGWHVFPIHGIRNGRCACRKGSGCGRPGKHPTTHSGFKAATTDPKIISTRWKWTGNIGIATGAISGIVVVDVDPRHGGDDSLREAQRQLGPLPPGPLTRTGGGGNHLLFRHPGNGIHVPSPIGIFPGVDVRADDSLIVAPPSLHESGNRYQWLSVPRTTPIPDLPSPWLEWVCKSVTETTDVTETTETTETSETTEDTVRGVRRQSAELSPCFEDFVQKAIQQSMPAGPGQRHHCLFRFARLLRGDSAIRTWQPVQLRPLVSEWYRAASISAGAEFRASPDENWFDFIESWDKVRCPGSEGLMTEMLERAKTMQLPAVATLYESEEVRLLVALCRELQREAGDQPFYLSSGKVDELFNLNGDRMRAHRWLKGLCLDGVLELVQKGNQVKANRYRYVLPLDE